MDQEPIYTEEDAMRHAEEQDRQRRASEKWFLFKCVFLLFIFLIVASIAMPFYKNHNRHRGMRMTQAISNSKQVYLVLMDFEADYGYFPDDQTAMKDPALHGFTGTFSNDYLGQMIASGHTGAEEIFYALNKRYRNIQPDGVISPPSHILEKNECGFAYVMVEEKGKRRGLTTADPGGIPVLVAPLVNEWGSCDQATFNKRGVYLRVDGSARSERLRSSDQKIMIGGGLTLFDTGPGTVWGPLKPVVLLPER